MCFITEQSFPAEVRVSDAQLAWLCPNEFTAFRKFQLPSESGQSHIHIILRFSLVIAFASIHVTRVVANCQTGRWHLGRETVMLIAHIQALTRTRVSVYMSISSKRDRRVAKCQIRIKLAYTKVIRDTNKIIPRTDIPYFGTLSACGYVIRETIYVSNTTRTLFTFELLTYIIYKVITAVVYKSCRGWPSD